MLSCKNCNHNKRYVVDGLGGNPNDRTVYECLSEQSPAWSTVVDYKSSDTHKENTIGLTTFMCNAHSFFKGGLPENTCKSYRLNIYLSKDTPNYCTARGKPCFDNDKRSLMLDYFWCNRYEQGQEEK